MEKFFERACPKCGELCATQELAKVAPGPGVHINMMCEHGHKWTEFYSLTYTGFWWNGKKYNSYGEEL